ncbi:MAG: tetratricopeptide repeat protein [Chloroflexi bacterium]|nr:tetratricopeptide repeat protein [Chloroflexota bacterium]
MAVFESEDRVRQKRAKTEQAINLATKGRWDEAARLNEEILALAPQDVDAHNRLGKALMELGRYAESRDAYAATLKLDPMNSIAQKNAARLQKLADEGGSALPPSAVDPRLFIEESGKTTVTQLTGVHRGDAIAKLAAGEQLQMELAENRIVVRDQAGSEIGRIEPKLEQDLLRLFKLGNRYSMFVTAASESSVSVIIRETARSAQMGTRPSFRPSSIPEGGFRSYTREGVLRYDLDDDDDDFDDDDDVEPGDRVVADPDSEPEVDADNVEVAPLETLAAAEAEAEETT